MTETAAEAVSEKTNEESTITPIDDGVPVSTNEQPTPKNHKPKTILNSPISMKRGEQTVFAINSDGEKYEKKVNALFFSFNDGSNVYMAHYRSENTWNSLLWKQNELDEVVDRTEKRTRNAIDKLEERTLRRLVKEMIELHVVKKPRDGLILLKNLISNLDDDDIEWLYTNAYADYAALEKTPWFFFIEGRKKIFNSEAIANYVITRYREHLSSNILAIEDTKDLFTYENGLYVKSTNDVNILVRETLGHYSSKHYVNESLESIRMKTLIERALFNKPNGDLNLNNGIFNYYTQEFRPHNVNSLFTYAMNIDYDPDATCPNIMKYLEWAQPDEKAIFTILEEMAYCLVNGYPIQRLFFWFGTGGNGKGTVMNVLIALLGENNVSHVSLQDLEKDRNYSQANLFGKKLNECGEIPATKTSFDFINAITGGDVRTVRGIYGTPFDLDNEAKMFFSMNEIPEITNVSDGPMRRLITTPWYSTKGEDGEPFDSKFMESLQSPDELSGLFKELVKLIPLLLERGDFKYAPDAAQSRKDLESLSGSDVCEFLLTKTSESVGRDMPVEPLHTLYKHWCEAGGIIPKPLKMFLMSARQLKYDESTKGDIHVFTGLQFTG